MRFSRMLSPLAWPNDIYSRDGSHMLTDADIALAFTFLSLSFFARFEQTATFAIQMLTLLLKIAHLMQDNGAIDIRIREIRIELDRQIKINQCKGKVAAPVRQQASRPMVIGVLHFDIGNCRKTSYGLRRRRNCDLFRS